MNYDQVSIDDIIGAISNISHDLDCEECGKSIEFNLSEQIIELGRMLKGKIKNTNNVQSLNWFNIGLEKYNQFYNGYIAKLKNYQAMRNDLSGIEEMFRGGNKIYRRKAKYIVDAAGIIRHSAQQVDSAEASTIAVRPSRPSGSPR